MTRLLITAIGGDIAQAAASIVRELYPDWTLFGTDIETRHAGARYVDHFSLGMRASDPQFLSWLDGFVDDNAIDFCLVMSEAELSALAHAGRDSVGKATHLLWAGRQIVLTGCDKLATADFLKSIGVPGPWTLAADAGVVPPTLPCIFKLRHSAGSKAVFSCETPEEIEFFRGRYPDAVLQELLSAADREVTCAIYRSRSGETAVLQLLRRLTGGFTGWAEVIDEPEITAQCTAIAEAANLHGAINAQLRIMPEGPRIFEINPRLSSTVLMRHLLAFTDVKWMLDEAMGLPVTLKLPKPGMRVARTQGAAVLPETDSAS